MKTFFKSASALSVNKFCRTLSRGTMPLGLLLSPFMGGIGVAAETPFYLKNGDRVCFYGDSITEQRYYGMDVAAYVRTRFPDLHVKFVNSGVGGDRVGGGWAGGIDERLQRDVVPFQPDVVTIMLGMNDAGYRPFDPQVFGAYTNGYEHIILSLQQQLPGVRIVLIEPTPYDDVTFPPNFPGGYNAVLQQYAAFVRQLAVAHHLMCVDFMTPLLDVMQKAQAQDPQVAQAVIPGRVHPSALGELLMAQALLKVWNAPAVVTSVTIDAAHAMVVQADSTTVTDVGTAAQTISWTQKDQSLPFPILGLHESWWQFPPTEMDGGSLTFFTPAPQPKWDYTDAASDKIVRLSGFYSALDQERLKVQGLTAGNYELKINGKPVGKFDAEQLDSGINLAEYDTPMLEQAYQVLDLEWKQVAWRFFAWRGIQTQLTFDRDVAVQKAADSLIAALYAQQDQMEDQQHVAGKPQPAHYELVRLTE